MLFCVCHVNSLCKLIICHEFFSSQCLKMTFQYLSPKNRVTLRSIHLLIDIVLHFLSFSSMLLERFEFYENKSLSLLDTFQKLLNNMKSNFTLFTFLIHLPWSYCAQYISAWFSKKKKKKFVSVIFHQNVISLPLKLLSFLCHKSLLVVSPPFFSNWLAPFCFRMPIFHGPMNSKWIISSPALPFSSLNIMFH